MRNITKNKAIPVYVVTGFLSSGKTTFLNSVFAQKSNQNKNICCIQFESGTAQFSLEEKEDTFQVLQFSKKQLEVNLKEIVYSIYEYLADHAVDEIWIEWNCMTSFSVLETLFSTKFMQHSLCLNQFCKVKRFIHVANANTIVPLIKNTGSVLIEQINNSDMIIINYSSSPTQEKQLKKQLKSISPNVKIVTDKTKTDVILKHLYQKNYLPYFSIFIGLACVAVFYVLGTVFFPFMDFSMNTFANMFLGIILQAFPFLIIGVLLSSAIQVFVSDRFIQRWFPKNKLLGMFLALICGFCLPVCDCAAIPMFRSLIKKGIPPSSAIVFMVATPVINPVVILSTFYAFNGNWKFVLARIVLGMVCSICIGIVFTFKKMHASLLSKTQVFMNCDCGCLMINTKPGWKSKISLYFRHSQLEFFNVGKFLLIGAGISCIFQMINTKIPWISSHINGVLSILLLMGMAFLMSLCSSSDAVVARSFSNQFPLMAILGFLVFGPMMDIKNIIMLSGNFSKKFVLKLILVTFCVCFIVITALSFTGFERLLT